MIGATVYVFDDRIREYKTDDGQRSFEQNKRAKYRPLTIVSETKLSWVTDNDGKINKKSGTFNGSKVFWNWDEVEQDLELKALKIKLANYNWFNSDLTYEQITTIWNILNQ
jgi:hypothetical protein